METASATHNTAPRRPPFPFLPNIIFFFCDHNPSATADRTSNAPTTVADFDTSGFPPASPASDRCLPGPRPHSGPLPPKRTERSSRTRKPRTRPVSVFTFIPPNDSRKACRPAVNNRFVPFFSSNATGRNPTTYRPHARNEPLRSALRSRPTPVRALRIRSRNIWP